MSKIRIALIEDHDLTRVGIRTALQQKDESPVARERMLCQKRMKLKL